MGLDQFAYAVKDNDEEATLSSLPQDSITVSTWRKHPYLEGWMSRLYATRLPEGCEGEDYVFNCKLLKLSKQDILQLKNDVRLKKLPKTAGFFFGNDASEHYYDQDLKFVKDSLQFMKQGYSIYYTSWW